jgi:hypothetical protein
MRQSYDEIASPFRGLTSTAGGAGAPSDDAARPRRYHNTECSLMFALTMGHSRYRRDAEVNSASSKLDYVEPGRAC